MEILVGYDDFIHSELLRTQGASSVDDVLQALHLLFPALESSFDMCAELDSVISDLYAVLAGVKTHRGTMLPIYTLPDDILSHIFRLYCFDANLQDGLSSSWSRIMLVCRRWYNLLMADGFLWSFLCTSSGYGLVSNYGALFRSLKRAGDWPLHIHHYGEDIYMYQSSWPLNEVASRIRTLRFSYVKRENLSRVMDVLLDSGLSSLQTICIRCNALSNGEEAFELPSALLTMPQLCHLDLEDVKLSIDLLPSTLTEFHCTMNTNTALFDLPSCLDTLSRLPNLEVLCLRRAFKDVYTKGADLPMITLPALRSLTVYEDEPIVSSLLQHIIIPRVERFDLLSYTTVDFPRTFSKAVLQPLAMQLRHSDASVPTPRTIHVEISGNARASPFILFNAYPHAELSRIPRASLPEDVPYGLITYARKSKQRTSICRRVFKTLTPDAEALDMRMHSLDGLELSVGWWKMALTSLPKLRTVLVSVDNRSCHNFCVALTQLMETHPRTFPRLEVLHLDRVSSKFIEFMRNHTDEDRRERDYDTMPRNNLHSLISLADLCKSRGEPFAKFVTNTHYLEWPGEESWLALSNLVGEMVHTG